MAQPSDKDGSSTQITESTCPKLNAAISEYEKLTEKHRLFTSGQWQAIDKAKSKIAFQEYGDELISCLSVMRRLMEEAESENKQLKQEKLLISTKIGSALGAVNREVEQLRVELQKQDRRLIELNSHGKMKDISTVDCSEELRQTKEEKDKIQAKYDALNTSYQELSEKSENVDRLSEQVRSYKEDIVRANETINCINSERRRLKSEKHDLLGQLREAYCIIEDKESELRDFITNYETRMRESEQRVESITNEKQKWLEEKRLMANTTPTQITQLKRALDEKDGQLKELHSELSDVKDQLTRLQQTLNYPVPKSDKKQVKRSPIPTTKLYESGTLLSSERPATEDSVATSGVSGQETSTDGLVLSNAEVYTNRATEADDLSYYKKRKRYGRFGLVRVFSRGKRKSTDMKDRPLSSLSNDGDNDVSDLVQIWQANKTIPISQWKSPAVIAFLHVHLQMPMYTDRCMENVKSGKILADMSDVELSKSLGIISFIHRRKIRLAIEDFRHPASIKYPKMGDIDHHFVAHDWLTHIGLSQYSFTFETQMVDGRLLGVMTRKDMEKYLNITSKFHQDSILFGVELLKHLGYDREVLGKRKEKCDEYDHDPLVWSNERVIRWCDSINLKEYSSNLRSSGVFGGLLVLNNSFGPEELAECLNIPAEKTAVRKHLVGELSSLMINARAGIRVKLRGSGRRSFRGRSKSFHRHSRRTGEYDVISNSNDDEVNRLLEPSRRTEDALNVSPQFSSKRGRAFRRSATIERPKSTDCERHLVE